MTPGLDGSNMRYMMRSRTALLFLCLGLGFTGCRSEKEPETDPTPLLTFDTGRVRLVTKTDTLSLVVEMARTREQQTMGLMERRRLADSAGMLFAYEATQPETAAFWMFRTRIPLDIAFADSAGVIRSIRQMVPCEAATAAQCPTYPPDVPYRSALEVNAGYFVRHGVVVGDRLIVSETRGSRGGH